MALLFVRKLEIKYHFIDTDFAFTSPVSNNALDLICRLLAKDPNERIGHSSLDGKEIMMHPFFEGLDWDLLIERKIPPPF